jgi:predicted nucleic acid-binding protein
MLSLHQQDRTQMYPLHLFIDTNVLLSFYALTHDDLEQLKKLIGLIDAHRLHIYVTQQVKDEFGRNREAKLNESLSQFEKLSFSQSMPRYIYEYKEAEDYRRALKELIDAHDALAKRARKEAESNSLEADTLLESVFEHGNLLEVDKELIYLAQQRMYIGNPPGKKGSVGDQINWEALLKYVDDGSDLFVVSNDGDYGSALIKTSPHQFLVDEWRRRKHGRLTLYRSLREFLGDHFPEIKLASDTESLIIEGKKRGIINILRFANELDYFPHDMVPRLMERAIPIIEQFSLDETKAVMEQFLKWHSDSKRDERDPNVRIFIQALIDKDRNALDAAAVQEVEDRLKLLQIPDEDEERHTATRDGIADDEAVSH